MKSSNHTETLGAVKTETIATVKRPSGSIFKAAVYEALMMGLFQGGSSVKTKATEHEPDLAPKPVKVRHAVDQFENYLRSGSRI